MSSLALILGGTGFLGHAVARRLAAEHNVVTTYQRQPRAGVAWRQERWSWPEEDLRPLVERWRPDLVLVAASLARGARPPSELVAGFSALAAACGTRRVLYVSSDAVFGGDRGRYREEDLARPATDYGRRQLLAEGVLSGDLADLCVVRSSYLYGHSDGELDRRLAETRRRLAGGETVELFADAYRSPIPVSAAAAAIAVLAATSVAGVVHLPGPRLSVLEFQRQALEALGAAVDRLRPARRPPLQPWDTSLAGDRCTALTGIPEIPVGEGMGNSI